MIEEPVAAQQLKWHAAAISERGQVRKTNEDAVFQRTDEVFGCEVGLFIICDGMGGLDAGDVASRLAVQTIAAAVEPEHLFSELDAARFAGFNAHAAVLQDTLKQAVLQANERIRRQIEDGQARKMGTTVNAMILHDDTAVIANVGDSRSYLWRDSHVHQITCDHTLVFQLVEQEIITPEQALSHPMRHVLTHALGSKDSLTAQDIDTYQLALQPGDRLLLCSDGLWQAFPENECFASAISQETTPEESCALLVQQANQLDGSDNISAVAVFIEEKTKRLNHEQRDN